MCANRPVSRTALIKVKNSSERAHLIWRGMMKNLENGEAKGEGEETVLFSFPHTHSIVLVVEEIRNNSSSRWFVCIYKYIYIYIYIYI